MQCKRCPHHVRHGKVMKDQKIEFSNRCGLYMRPASEKDEIGSAKGRTSISKEPRESKEVDCHKYPFSSQFDYTQCEVYQHVFRTKGQRNDVVPTKDFQYSEALTSGSITDMELL